MKNILEVGNIINTYYEDTKVFQKGRKPGLFVNFGQFLCSWIQICIPNTNPNRAQPNESGSRRIRIHNTGVGSRQKKLLPVLPIRIRIWLRIHMFLGLLDPDPHPDLDPSITKQKK